MWAIPCTWFSARRAPSAVPSWLSCCTLAAMCEPSAVVGRRQVVQGMAADAADPGQAVRAAADAAVIYHCVSPPYTQWPELFPALTGSILSAAESSGAKLVFADNLYAYGPVDGPLREDLPASARGRKGRIRVEMAAQLHHRKLVAAGHDGRREGSLRWHRCLFADRFHRRPEEDHRARAGDARR
jgi:hypothetical protein